jgi:phosphoglycerol transferase MdoB-like AlkP superfamily enzyme
MTEWLKQLFARYWSRRRLLYPALLFFGILLVVELLMWRINLPTPIGKEYFSLPGATGGSAGSYLVRRSKSKILLVLGALIATLAITIYRHSVEVFTDVSLSTVLFLVLLCFVGFGALFMELRILMNMGLD